MNAAHRAMISAVCKLPRQLLLVLVPERAVASHQAAVGLVHAHATVH
jgi:hypothetical protein